LSGLYGALVAASALSTVHAFTDYLRKKRDWGGLLRPRKLPLNLDNLKS